MKNKKVIVLLLLCLCMFGGCSKKSNEEIKIVSKNLYNGNVYKWIDKEKQIFQIPLITNKQISEFSIQSMEGSNIDEKYISYEIEEQENYKGYYIYMILFYVNSELYQEGKDVMIHSMEITMDNVTVDYDFGEILIQDVIVDNDNEMISYVGQGVMYPDISEVDIDLHAEKDVTLKEVTLSNDFQLLNKEQFLKTYKAGQDIPLAFVIDREQIKDSFEFYCYDVCLSFSDGTEERRYYGISSISTIVLDKSIEYIDSLGE